MKFWMIILFILLFFNLPWGIRLINLIICIPFDIWDGYPDSPKRYLRYFVYGDKE